MAGMKWSKRPSDAFEEASREYADQIDKSVARIVARFKPQIENHMSAEAPWEDRTGNARQALFANIERVIRKSIAIDFGHGHGIEYGIYLEFANAGKYAIVGPTFDKFAPKIWAEIETMLR